MGMATTYSRAMVGMEAPLVTVETHLSNGLPSFSIVGLPETAVRESKERVRSAIINSGLDFPARRITVNLGPASLPKSGGRYDLAIALGILAASSQLPAEKLLNYETFGELSLNGDVRAVDSVLPALLACRSADMKILIPLENAKHAELVANRATLLADNLLSVFSHMVCDTALAAISPASETADIADQASNQCEIDYAQIVGQQFAKRGLKIAAAGGHNLLMCGPPGTGKTLLASVLQDLIPNLNREQSVELAIIQSLSPGVETNTLQRKPPFRSPHHTASSAALVGGSAKPRPGEVSLAHHGILFLDELSEFSAVVLEALREPLESGSITIARASYHFCFPARFQLVAATNPCPCGFAGDPVHECYCTVDRIRKYQAKISGPLLDRIDLHIAVPRLSAAERSQSELQEDKAGAQTSQQVREEVQHCREAQLRRQSRLNTDLNSSQIKQFCGLGNRSNRILEDLTSYTGLSFRATSSILKIARTVADLAGQESIRECDLAEAISYRQRILKSV